MLLFIYVFHLHLQDGQYLRPSDPAYDQVLDSLAMVARHTPVPLLEALLRWRGKVRPHQHISTHVFMTTFLYVFYSKYIYIPCFAVNHQKGQMMHLHSRGRLLNIKSCLFHIISISFYQLFPLLLTSMPQFQQIINIDLLYIICIMCSRLDCIICSCMLSFVHSCARKYIFYLQ